MSHPKSIGRDVFLTEPRKHQTNLDHSAGGSDVGCEAESTTLGDVESSLFAPMLHPKFDCPHCAFQGKQYAAENKLHTLQVFQFIESQYHTLANCICRIAGQYISLW